MVYNGVVCIKKEIPMPPAYTAISGTLVIIGKQPDGDSVRFVPDLPAQLRALAHAERLKPSKEGSIQLRLDAVDAPEVHYQGQAQPLGDEARNALLDHLGFSSRRLDGNVITSSQPATIPA